MPLSSWSLVDEVAALPGFTLLLTINLQLLIGTFWTHEHLRSSSDVKGLLGRA